MSLIFFFVKIITRLFLVITFYSLNDETNWQIWQLAESQQLILRLPKSEMMLEDPAMCLTETWKRLTIDKKMEIRGLAENSPRQSFSKACTQALLSVRT